MPQPATPSAGTPNAGKPNTSAMDKGTLMPSAESWINITALGLEMATLKAR